MQTVQGIEAPSPGPQARSGVSCGHVVQVRVVIVPVCFPVTHSNPSPWSTSISRREGGGTRSVTVWASSGCSVSSWPGACCTARPSGSSGLLIFFCFERRAPPASETTSSRFAVPTERRSLLLHGSERLLGKAGPGRLRKPFPGSSSAQGHFSDGRAHSREGMTSKQKARQDVREERCHVPGCWPSVPAGLGDGAELAP